MAAGAKAYIRATLFFIPLSFLLTDAISFSNGDDKKGETTPYNYAMPAILLKVPSPADNPTTVEGVALGRKLFYDPILSGNGKQACSGCHKQELAFTDGLDISMGALGRQARRNSMSLVNLGLQDKYFWDGRAMSLEDLIHFPVTDTLEMNTDTSELANRLNKDKNYKALFKKAFNNDTISMNLVAKAISQFLRTIVSYNTPFDRIFQDYVNNKGPVEGPNINDLQLLINGLASGNEQKYEHDPSVVNAIKLVSPDTLVLKVFSRCITCHYNSLQLFCIACTGVLPANAKVQFKNNGLEVEGNDKGLYQITKNEKDKYRFKVPTFRNLIFSAPYMHDGRYKTLEEVVDHYNSGIQPNENLDSLLKDKSNNPIRFHMNDEEKKELVGLLKLFSDSSITTDSRFAKP